MGGKPSPGTRADRRLKANRSPRQSTNAKPAFPGSAPPFKAKAKK